MVCRAYYTKMRNAPHGATSAIDHNPHRLDIKKVFHLPHHPLPSFAVSVLLAAPNNIINRINFQVVYFSSDGSVEWDAFLHTHFHAVHGYM